MKKVIAVTGALALLIGLSACSAQQVRLSQAKDYLEVIQVETSRGLVECIASRSAYGLSCDWDNIS